MFTGIVKELGLVHGLDRAVRPCRLAVKSKAVAGSVEIGDSVAVNGVCLTLVKKDKGILYFDVMEETIRRSNLAALKEKDYVNLESSLKADGVLGGHFVLGHIDCVAAIKDIGKSGEEVSMEIGIPENFSRLVIEKGSIAIDGVSLTVGEIGKDLLRVYLVPHTLRSTILGLKKAGDNVNVEFDMIGKYIVRLKNSEKTSSRITESFLREKGF